MKTIARKEAEKTVKENVLEDRLDSLQAALAEARRELEEVEAALAARKAEAGGLIAAAQGEADAIRSDVKAQHDLAVMEREQAMRAAARAQKTESDLLARGEALDAQRLKYEALEKRIREALE